MRDETLMLIDDDQLEHMKLKNTFKKLGFECKIVSAFDGEEGIEYLEKNKHNLPGIILLDLNMPKMNGIEFLEIIKSDSLLKLIPIIILTTSSKEDDRMACYEHQVAGYMIKPDNFTDYQNLIASITNYWSRSELAL